MKGIGKGPEVGRVQDITKELKRSQRGWTTECDGRAPVSIFKYLFTYLAALGINCGMQDLQSLLRHVGSLVVACGI